MGERPKSTGSGKWKQKKTKVASTGVGLVISPTIEEKEVQEVQQRAEAIIQRKKKERRERQEKKAIAQLATGPTTGVQHLHRLNLVPEDFGRRSLHTDTETEEEMEWYTRRGQGKNSKLDEHFVDNITGGSGECSNCQNISKIKVKSGKFARVSTNLQRQEEWPHNAVSKKYAKRATFDTLEYDAFVAGEVKIIQKMFKQEDMEATGRLQVLNLVAHWMCRTKNWGVVKSLYEAIMEEVEMGDETWNSDFTSYEMMLPSPMAVSASQALNSNKEVKRNTEVYWCKGYQTNNCEKSSPHLAQIKPDEPMVQVLHICAFCWGNYHKKKEHMEVECSAKKS